MGSGQMGNICPEKREGKAKAEPGVEEARWSSKTGMENNQPTAV